MIEFRNVEYAYPDGHKVLHDITFSIAEKEKVGLVGANGAGKSTLLKALPGLIFTQGSITVDGLEMKKENIPAIRQKIGYVLQDADNQMFMPTVSEDMIFGLLNSGMSREEALKRADEVLAFLKMEHLKDKYNHRISGGEKRMAAIATVLMSDPDILVMDEPSSNLDPYNRRQLIRTLNLIPRTKVIAAHDLDLILETCDRVILIGEGRIRADGPCRDILSDQKLLEDNHLELPLSLGIQQ